MARFNLITLMAVGALICSCGEYEPSVTWPQRPDYTPKFGTVFDERNGRTYRTTVINGLEWMAENLDYAVDSSSCYNDDPVNCEKYGRLYRWEVAMALDSNAFNVRQWTAGKKYQGVCPQGWRMPTLNDFKSLIDFVYEWKRADNPFFLEEIQYDEWYYLKSKDGWANTNPENDYDGGYTREYGNMRQSVITKNGSDAFGFSLLPAGWRDYDKYDKNGRCAAFWTSDEREIDEREFSYSDNYYATIANYYCNEHYNNEDIWTNYRVSVRCVKD